MDELYVLARRVLLNALDALGEHRSSVVLVGAQAIYVRVGDGDLAAVAPFTTDGDLAVDPRVLKEIPPLEQAMLGANFIKKDVGVWLAREQTADNVNVDVTVDLLAPQALSPAEGSRNAGLVGHVDCDVVTLRALESVDGRAHELRVGGPAALLVAKATKIADRVGTKRLKDKDALDVLRLLRGTDTADVAARDQRLLNDPMAGAQAAQALALLKNQFGTANAVGVEMAVKATATLVDADEVRASCTLLANDLFAAL